MDAVGGCVSTQRGDRRIDTHTTPPALPVPPGEVTDRDRAAAQRGREDCRVREAVSCTDGALRSGHCQILPSRIPQLLPAQRTDSSDSLHAPYVVAGEMVRVDGLAILHGVGTRISEAIGAIAECD